MDNKEICIIRAKQLKDDYVYDALQTYGYDIHIPYKDRNLLLRLLREAWFRLKLPNRSCWFNKEISSIDSKIIIIYDPLIVPEFIEWIRTEHPCARIVLCYENRVDTTINPRTIDAGIEKWSYDRLDCTEYGMKTMEPSYFDIYRFDSNDYPNKKYDVLYLGRDKGRLDTILYYKRILESCGLTTYFHICADRSFMRFKKRIYRGVLPYKEYLNLMKSSRAILNIAREDQEAITQRELEAVFDNVKCITTNKGIKDWELFDPSRFFVLGEDSIEALNDFMKMPFNPVPENELTQYATDRRLAEMLENRG